MSEKQDLIKRMLEMQQEFMKWEHDGGLNGKEYFDTDKLKQYRAEYMELADKVVNLAHTEKGSLRE